MVHYYHHYGYFTLPHHCLPLPPLPTTISATTTLYVIIIIGVTDKTMLGNNLRTTVFLGSHRSQPRRNETPKQVNSPSNENSKTSKQ